MTKLELESIKSQIQNLKNLPNAALITFMDKLTSDFEVTKENLIQLTYHLDTVEELYNTILNEYKTRVNE